MKKTTKKTTKTTNSNKTIPKKLYHVTSPEAAVNILKEGLKGNTAPRLRGETTTPSIYTLIDANDNLTAHVATNQIWVNEDIKAYAVLEIDLQGITGQVVADNVAERSAGFHRVVEQELIEPQFIRLYKTRDFDFPGSKIFELGYVKIMEKEPWSKADWEIANKWFDETTLRIRHEIEADNLASKN